MKKEDLIEKIKPAYQKMRLNTKQLNRMSKEQLEDTYKHLEKDGWRLQNETKS